MRKLPSRIDKDPPASFYANLLGYLAETYPAANLDPKVLSSLKVNAFSVPGWDAVNWTVIEYSALSASILRRARPDVTVIQGSFEQWILSAGGRLDGRLGLVLCNPPFGQRGAEAAIDPDPAYRERKAYFYFLRRCLGLLAEGGIGVFVIPYGFLSSPAPQFVRLREQVLKAHHLIAAFRLPSSIYPGAGIVTDAILLESRGGRLQEVLAADRYIVEGNYFAENPGHLLGVERGARGEEEEAFRYEVLGDFTGLPDTPKLRERCRTCVLERRASEVPRAVQLEREREAAMPEIVAHAAGIGRRVSRYLDLTSVGGLASQAQARAMRQELKDDLLVWAASHSLSSLEETSLGAAYRSTARSRAFLPALG